MEGTYLDMISVMHACGVIYLYPPAMVEKANEISRLVPMSLLEIKLRPPVSIPSNSTAKNRAF